MAKILVAGTNKDKNDETKKYAIAAFKNAGHQVEECCQIYRSYDDDLEGNLAVDRVLKESDIFYVACTNHYTGYATTLRMGKAHERGIPIYSSNELEEKDIKWTVKRIISPGLLIEEIKEYGIN